MAILIHVNSLRYYYDSEGSSAFVKVHDDGSVTLVSGITEIGQGADTVMGMIVAEELGVRYEDVKVVSSGGSDQVPDDLGAYASRSTFISGNAVKTAAADVKGKIFVIAAKMLGVHAEDLVAKDRKIYVKGRTDLSVDFSTAVKEHLYNPEYTGHTLFLIGQGSVDAVSDVPDREGYGNASPTYIFAAHVAEVEVDMETGEVQVLKHSAAVDVGRVINPLTAEGQIEGAVSQGIGYCLLENIVWDKGKTLNPNLLDYRIPTVFESPEVIPILVESEDPLGPFGAKGLGEPGLVPVAASISNAIYNAVGVRMDVLPITPEKLLKAIKEKRGEKYS